MYFNDSTTFDDNVNKIYGGSILSSTIAIKASIAPGLPNSGLGEPNPQYPGLTMCDSNKIEGYENSDDSLKNYFSNWAITNSGGPPLVFGGAITRHIQDSRKGDNGFRALAVAAAGIATGIDVNSGRQVWYGPSGSAVAPGGGGAPPEPLEFLTGGIWGPRQFDGETFSLEPALKAGFLKARRPGEFRSIKQNKETVATIYIYDIGGSVYFATTNFILSGVQKKIGDVFVPQSTMRGTSVHFIPEKNQVFQLSGRLLDTKDYDWARSWGYNWDRYLSGSTTARNNCQFAMLYDGMVISGYLMGYSMSFSSQMPYLAGLNVTSYITEFKSAQNVDIQSGSYTITEEASYEGDYFAYKDQPSAYEITDRIRKANADHDDTAPKREETETEEEEESS